jgi:hypothetical protein
MYCDRFFVSGYAVVACPHRRAFVNPLAFPVLGRSLRVLCLLGGFKDLLAHDFLQPRFCIFLRLCELRWLHTFLPLFTARNASENANFKRSSFQAAEQISYFMKDCQPAFKPLAHLCAAAIVAQPPLSAPKQSPQESRSLPILARQNL